MENLGDYSPNSRSEADSRDENLKARIRAAAGESKEERKQERVSESSRSILDAPAAAIQSAGLSSRCPGDEPNGPPIFQSVIGKSEIRQSLIEEFIASSAVADSRLRSVVGERGKWSGERRGEFSESRPERNAAAEPQTEARRFCGTLRMPARDERAVCAVERAWSRAGQGRPEAREAKQTARWSRR